MFSGWIRPGLGNNRLDKKKWVEEGHGSEPCQMLSDWFGDLEKYSGSVGAVSSDGLGPLPLRCSWRCCFGPGSWFIRSTPLSTLAAGALYQAMDFITLLGIIQDFTIILSGHVKTGI